LKVHHSQLQIIFFNEEEFSIKGKFLFMAIRTKYSIPGDADDIDTLLNGVIINKKLKIIM
jgi:hypothetical protein